LKLTYDSHFREILTNYKVVTAALECLASKKEEWQKAQSLNLFKEEKHWFEALARCASYYLFIFKIFGLELVRIEENGVLKGETKYFKRVGV